MLKLTDLNTDSFEEIKKSLRQLNDNPDFAWLKPIVNRSLDEEVILYLNSKPPDLYRLITLNIQEHIEEVIELLNKNLQKREEIFALETIGIYTAIDLIETLSNENANKELGKLSLKSIFKQENKDNTYDSSDFSAYSDFFSEKVTNIHNSTIIKIKSLNQKGSSLNFGERIEFLRQVYCDNIRLIYERLVALKRTLLYSFKLETQPIPNYIDIANNLDDINLWLREAVYNIETINQNEFIIQKSLSIKDYAVSKGIRSEDFLNNLKNNLSTEIEISGNEFDIDKGISINSINHTFRLLSIGVNIIDEYSLNDNAIIVERENNNKELTSYTIEVKPPKQSVTLNAETLFTRTTRDVEEITSTEIIQNPFNRRDIDILGIDPVSGKLIIRPKIPPYLTVNTPDNYIVFESNSIFKSFNDINNMKTGNSILNTNPIGTWKLNIKNSSFRKDLRESSLTNVKDVVITFNISFRKLY